MQPCAARAAALLAASPSRKLASPITHSQHLLTYRCRCCCCCRPPMQAQVLQHQQPVGQPAQAEGDPGRQRCEAPPLQPVRRCPNACIHRPASLTYRQPRPGALWPCLSSHPAAACFPHPHPPCPAGGVLRLPLIKNKKTVNPRDASTPAVYQLVSEGVQGRQGSPPAVVGRMPARGCWPLARVRVCVVVRPS